MKVGAIIAKAFRRAKQFAVRWTDVPPIHVDAYSGYKANERPRDFRVDEDLFEIAEVEDRWYEPDAMYFRVRTSEGRRCILRYEDPTKPWVEKFRPEDKKQIP